MGLAIAGNPANEHILCSASLERSLRRGRLWDEPVAAGLMFRMVDLTVERPGWFKVWQRGINVSCLRHGTFGSSYFRHGDADAREDSLRIFALDGTHCQLVHFSRPTRYRLVQLVLDPDRLGSIASDLDQDPGTLARTMRHSCHVDRRFAVTNRPLPREIGSIVEDLLDSAPHHGQRRMRLYGRAIEILAHTLDAIRPPGGETGAPPDDPVARAAAILNRDYRTPPAMPELARQVGLGEDALLRAFRARFGLPPSGYLGLVRMAEAKRLLAESRLPVADVGRRVGFSNHAAFSRAFRRHFGCAPSARPSDTAPPRAESRPGF